MEQYRIVIADDEVLSSMDLREMLEEAGHEVVGVGVDGVEALELVEKWKPDVAVLDVKMPRLDGLQAAKIIAHNQWAPVVLLTAFGDENIIKKAGESMVFGYVMKPVEEKNLFPALTIAVSQFKKRVEMVERVRQMEADIAEKKIMSRAKGLLMDCYGITENEAHRRIQVISMKRSMTLSEVSQQIIKEIMARKNKSQ
ncbi:ANTAR domain-containing response regulator [Dialister pneumosintes]|uniref:Fis family transcriptional regulator n=1 Tax=Dialister pneumosintes TaxID=39950 RepID=A0A1B3WE12_9FIRM|nr:response regulator [Dialister pneumosintes]AOH39200.1 Fis family transcriptional regulator [Dialister pneumosintes]MBS6480642.1 response regulator [Dialister sp.]